MDRSTASRDTAIGPASRTWKPAFAPVVVHGRDASDPPAGPRHAVLVADKSGDVTLNFAGADIRDVITEVLGETLKLNYVVDPEVSGPVTFNVSRPVRRDELLSTLEAVLNSRGATMVRDDGIVRVVPMRKDGKPVAAAPVVAGASASGAQMVGAHTAMFPLRFVAATDMQRVLEKVLPPGQVISADDKRHMLVVQGSASELQLAQDTVRVFDVDQLSGMSMALVPLASADPTAVADELKNIFATTRKEIDSDAIRFMAVARLNAVMIISRSAQYLDEARAWVGRLDRSGSPNERRVYVHNLQYGKAVQIGQQLQGLLSGLDIQFRAPGGGTADAVGAAIGADAGQTAPAGPNGSGPNGKPAAPPASPTLVAAKTGDPTGEQRGSVRIEADEAHNALLISASPRDYDLVRQVLQGIDVPPLQVLIEVTVAEVTLNDQLNYGVEYYINAGNTNALLTTGVNPFAITPSVPGFAFSWVTGSHQPRAILDALSKVTETKVISTPRLLVLSNQTARLQVGDVVPIITQSATSTVTSNPLVLNNVTYKETGVVLEVTPRVNSGGVVTMDVNQSVSTVVPTTTSTIDSPTIQQRRLTSTISVKSSETVLLGGMIQQQNSRNSSGIPLLNELPGIGALFGTRQNGAGRTELIMLMTPHVIGSDDAARVATARVKQEFQEVLDGNSLRQPRRPVR